MSQKKRQEKKQKQRKEKAKQRVLARRVAIRREAKKDDEARRAEDKYGQKQRPFRRGQEELPAITLPDDQSSMSGYTPSLKEIRDKLIIDRLKHNQEILKAIEDEYREERENREKAKKLDPETLSQHPVLNGLIQEVELAKNVNEFTDDTTIK